MGIYDRPYYQDEPRSSFSMSGRSMIVNLIIINAAVFVIDAFLFGPQNAQYRPSRWMAVWSETLLQPWKWWQFVTYGFCHSPNNAGHIFGNMLGLFFLGQDIEQLYGRKLFLRMYLTTLIACSVVWGFTEVALGRHNDRLIGASGAVTAVVMLFAFNFPRRTILFMMFIPMPAWVLGVMLVFFNLMGVRTGTEGNERIAFDVHLVGAAYGYLFFRTRWALGMWPSGRWTPKLRWPRAKPKLKVHRAEEPYSVLDEQADAVLDKLHREGLESLTPRERRILEEYSRRMQQKHR